MFEEIHLPEQVGLLLAVEQRRLVQGRQLRRSVLGHAHAAAGRLEGLGVGHGSHDPGFLRGVVEGGVGDIVQGVIEEPLGADLVDHAVNRSPGPAEPAC